MADPRDEGMQEVEREAMFFAVLRERTRPVDPHGTPELAPPPDALGRYEDAEREISEWLDEAEEEGSRIIEQARAEAARLRLEAHEQAERLRQAAERAAADAARDRDRILRQAEVEAARAEAETNARAAEVLRQAERTASALYADRVERAEREAEWLRTRASSDARAIQSHAAATVQALQADVGTLQEQLSALVEHAAALLPALEAASRSLALGPGEAPALSAAPEPTVLELAEERGLGRLVGPPPDEVEAEEAAEAGEGGAGHADRRNQAAELHEENPVPDAVARRRPLGRLLRRA